MTKQAEPRWLSPQEQQAWIGATALMWLLPGPLDAQLQRDSGLNLFDYFVLATLSMAEGRQRRMSDLASQSNASPSRVSNVVSRLERQGWVTLTVGSDRRRRLPSLTAEGRAVFARALPHWKKAQAEVAGLLEEKLNDTNRKLVRLTRAIA